MDQLRYMTVSHFLAGTCYGSGLQITQIPQVSTASSWDYSQLFPTPVYYNATVKILCPFSPPISSTCTLIKLSFCSAAFSQMVSLICQMCSMLHLSLKATLFSHALATLLLFKTYFCPDFPEAQGLRIFFFKP